MKKARSLFSLILSLALVVTSLPMVFMTAVAETTDGGAELTYKIVMEDGVLDGSIEKRLKDLKEVIKQ